MADESPVAGELPQTSSYLVAIANRFTPDQIQTFLDASVRPLFVYGTLMNPYWAAGMAGGYIDGDGFEFAKRMTPATLSMHQRLAVRDAYYPAVIPSNNPEHSVTGLVLFGLTAVERENLDGYEGCMYTAERVQVEILLVSGTRMMIDADVYIWSDPLEHLCQPSEKEWDYVDY
ncbi:hypothetical protein MMC12_000962 [Toensbergia leucococca]|nr:hypothetical protein [Toensbergia leucococca]